jgi:murein DD-endopeptidase MepM/ murein hydrolase activator NlpD
MHLAKAPFTQMLIAANDIDPDEFLTWVFCKEMLFRALGKWWGDFGQRDFPHEGIDFCLYADRSGKIKQLGARTLIPVMHDGVVKAIFEDYLGQAVIIEHPIEGDPKGKYLSAYAHTVPKEGVQPGVAVKRGDLIAAIAETSGSKVKILPHLHFSFGRISPKLTYEAFVWNIIRDPELVTLYDPMEILDGPHQEMDAGLDLYLGKFP